LVDCDDYFDVEINFLGIVSLFVFGGLANIWGFPPAARTTAPVGEIK